MKKTLVVCSLAVMLSVAVAASAATTLKAKCNDEKGKTVPCVVQTEQNSLKLTYTMKQHAGLSRSIPSSAITRITSGEFSKQRTAEAILLSPLFLLSKRKFESFNVEYTQDGRKDFVTIAVKQKEAQMMRGLLQTVYSPDITTTATDKSGLVK
jgi:hypothetical protein